MQENPNKPKNFIGKLLHTQTSPKKRLLIILGSILLVLILIITISINSLPKQSQKPDTNSQVTITFWGKSVEEASMNEIIKVFEAENPLIKVKYEKRSPTQYREVLTQRLKIRNLDSLPDIAEVDEAWVEELSSYLNKFTDQTTLGRFSRTIQMNNTVGNAVYAVPFKFDSLALAYNKDQIAKNNLTEASFNKLDWSSLLTRAKDLTTLNRTKQTNGKEIVTITHAGMAIGNPETVTNADKILELLLIQNESAIYNGKTKKYALDTTFDDTFRFYTNFAIEKTWDDTFGNDIEAFAKEKVSMIIVKSADIDKIKTLNPNLQFATILPPKIGVIKNLSLSTSLINPFGRPPVNQVQKFLEFLSRIENGTKLFNSKNKNTFIPSQLGSLSEIPKSSPFSVYSDINPNAEKFLVPDYEATSDTISAFLQANYKANFGSQKIDQPNIVFKYNAKDLENSLNKLLPTPTATATPTK